LYSILASLSRVAGGGISDRFGGERVAAISLIALAIGAFGMAVVPPVGLAVGSMLVMAIAMGVANAAVFKLVPQAVPKAVGGAAGWVGGLGAFGGFVLPNVMAAFLVSGSDGYARGFIVFIALAIISFIAIVVIARSFRAAAANVGSET
jgi:NNP family nitrate/nitrite transporter-like MFS transporter